MASARSSPSSRSASSSGSSSHSSIPGSGFRVDLASFQAWAAEPRRTRASHGFYERPFFHDYTPGYLYVLYAGRAGRERDWAASAT